MFREDDIMLALLDDGSNASGIVESNNGDMTPFFFLLYELIFI